MYNYFLKLYYVLKPVSYIDVISLQKDVLFAKSKHSTRSSREFAEA